MASKALKTTSLLLTLNLLFFTLVISDPTPQPTCSVDGLKFGACAGLLNNWLGGVEVGTPPTLPCCSLFFGLVNLEAAACVCLAIKANVLGIDVNPSIGLSVLLNNCGKEVPSGFQC